MDFYKRMQIKLPDLRNLSDMRNLIKNITIFDAHLEVLEVLEVPFIEEVKVYNIEFQYHNIKQFVYFYIAFCIYYQMLIKIYK
jgi:hypothetical protein